VRVKTYDLSTIIIFVQSQTRVTIPFITAHGPVFYFPCIQLNTDDQTMTVRTADIYKREREGDVSCTYVEHTDGNRLDGSYCTVTVSVESK
jgi:hypothetical protein